MYVAKRYRKNIGEVFEFVNRKLDFSKMHLSTRKTYHVQKRGSINLPPRFLFGFDELGRGILLWSARSVYKL